MMKKVLSRAGVPALFLVGAAVTLGVTVQGQAPQPGKSQQVTFTKDVAPILNRSCVRCHRPEEIAPMSLLNYSEARPWARSIKDRVTKREMPPWFLDKTIGIQKYKEDPSLTDAEIATIVKWVDSGAPQGNPADAPPQPKAEDVTAWKIGTPDLVLQYPTFEMPAAGPDLYGTLTAPFNQKEDRYIKAIQSRVVGAGSRQVIHHALSFAVDPNEEGDMGDDAGGGSGQFLVEYASGKNATFYTEGTGQLLQAGTSARVSYHFHSIGEKVDAKLELGIVFYPKGYVPKYTQWSKQLGQDGAPDLDIPANGMMRRDGYTRLQSAARLMAWQPHTHIRGKYQCLELIYPGVPVKTEVVTCANWNYNWHTIYNYADDVAPLVPAGTLLHVITWFDNTTANKHNPDPKNWVGAGIGRTIDEMGFSWIGWYDLSDEEYKTQIAERKAGQVKSQTQQQQQQQ
jgi:hypothetical protein